MKRVNYIEINGEKVKVETPVFPFCDHGEDWDIVPVVKDEDGADTCLVCGYAVIYTTREEISNNARR